MVPFMNRYILSQFFSQIFHMSVAVFCVNREAERKHVALVEFTLVRPWTTQSDKRSSELPLKANMVLMLVSIHVCRGNYPQLHRY